MYRSYAQTIEQCKKDLDLLRRLGANATIDVALLPSTDALSAVGQIVAATGIYLGAQDCSAHDLGAYTGQVAAQSLRELGCSFVIIGHSERRAASDTDEIIAQKVGQAFKAGLAPIICIGEPEAVYNLGQTQQFLTKQLQALQSILSAHTTHHFNIAYEPVWAIGSGKTPTPPEISNTISCIRNFLETEIGSSQFRILYGGSVNQKNAGELKNIEPFEGFLVGKASLDIQEFAHIINMIE